MECLDQLNGVFPHDCGCYFGLTRHALLTLLHRENDFFNSHYGLPCKRFKRILCQYIGTKFPDLHPRKDEETSVLTDSVK